MDLQAKRLAVKHAYDATSYKDVWQKNVDTMDDERVTLVYDELVKSKRIKCSN